MWEVKLKEAESKYDKEASEADDKYKKEIKDKS
jgi:hypothetical protein